MSYVKDVGDVILIVFVCNAIYVKDVKDRSNTPKGCNTVYVKDVEDGERTYRHIFIITFLIWYHLNVMLSMSKMSKIDQIYLRAVMLCMLEIVIVCPLGAVWAYYIKVPYLLVWHCERLYTRLNKVTLCFSFGGSRQNLKVREVKCIPGDPTIMCPVLFKGVPLPTVIGLALRSLLYVPSLSRKAVLMFC